MMHEPLEPINVVQTGRFACIFRSWESLHCGLGGVPEHRDVVRHHSKSTYHLRTDLLWRLLSPFSLG